jgi:2,3-bisphosphoglycerate-independent phosphoglycerate mutase
MKYAICVGDGMADFPVAELNGTTPLEYAKTPAMDEIAALGYVGRVQTVPDGLPPGSDVANMSLLGYDAKRYYQGRAPIEAASMGIALKPNETAFRCNLVTLQNGKMADYSAGHIETGVARELLEQLQEKLGNERMRFYPGVSYRHLLVIADAPVGKLDCTPPHDISGKPWQEYVPRGAGSNELLSIMDKARTILETAGANQRLIDQGKQAATDIWLWGQGRAIELPSMMERFGLTGSVISAVDLVQGLGVLAGLTVRKVAGATGYLGTNYAGKVEAAHKALREQDFVFIHIEAPDETSHEGSLYKKIQAIEEFDHNIVAEILNLRKEFKDLRILVLPDHATPVSLKTHHAMPVPFAVCGPAVGHGSAAFYSEKTAADKPLITAVSLFETFINGVFQ